MKLGLVLPVFTDHPRKVLDFAARAEELAFDGVFAADHLYPPMGPTFPSVEVFSTLAAVAARSERLTVGTLVARVGLRGPGLLAKEAAALDAMTGGDRAILTLGAGDKVSLGEHEMFGFGHLGVEDRRARLEETVRAVKALFAGEAWSGGAWTPAMTGPLVPPPPSPGGPPVWIGGVGDEMVRIAGRVADGWNGWGLEADGFAAKAALLREAAEGRAVAPTWGGITLVARDRDELDSLLAARAEKGLSVGPVWSGTAEDLRAFASRLGDHGAEWAIFLPAGPADRVELIAETLRG
jgi:alkanesulfonate monooxygenase SsuD/methylene tetrahydromethanopterin reductase-like flavin-dependent oxidoreductase (luciferase family)